MNSEQTQRPHQLFTQETTITLSDREQLNQHRSCVVWLTGLSGAGKSTLANQLEVALFAQGKRTFLLDGDNVRQGLNRDLGFSEADRSENIRRVAEVAKLMADAGLIVITAFISPYRKERDLARRLIGSDRFIEEYVSTPFEVCEYRDTKGLYAQARRGELKNMTEIDSPYEPPQSPQFVAPEYMSSADAIKSILELLA